MCTCAPLDTCPSGHRVPKSQKISPPHPFRKIKNFLRPSPRPSHPFPTLPTSSYAVHPPGRNRSGRPPRGFRGDHGSAITGRVVVTGDHGTDRQGRVVWRGVEGVGRGSPCDGVMSVPVSRDSPGGRWEGVVRAVPHVTGSGLDSISVIPPPRPFPDPPGGDGGRKM